MRIVTVARKPCVSSSTTANVTEHEAGAINVNACRIEFSSASDQEVYKANASGDRGHEDNRSRQLGFKMGCGTSNTEGRWPANVIIIGSESREALDAQSGQLTSGTGAVKRASSKEQQGNRGAAYGAESRPDGAVMVTYGDTGGASRFYKCFEDEDQSE